VEAFGERELPLPERVSCGLIANDRVHHYVTLLEAAMRHRPSAGELVVPAAQTIVHGLFAELAVMLQSLRAAAGVVPGLRPALSRYALRLARLHADASYGDGDGLPAEAMDILTRDNRTGDSVPQLTSDLRAELNRVLALIADDTHR
jgi:hypothetical protein